MKIYRFFLSVAIIVIALHVSAQHDKDEYNTHWHNPPVSQGKTGTCWCFATISFLESEVYLKTGKEIRLSEMFIVYWEYVERAKAFVNNRGDVYFAEGSEATSVIRMIKKYGMVPFSAYPGKAGGQEFHNHSVMFHEMDNFLKHIAKTDTWNTDLVTSTIKDILNHYMGEPPEKFNYKGTYFTPLDFTDKILELKPIDYFSFMSTMSLPYNQKGELVEADNWWHCDDYYNVSVDDFYWIIRNSLREGYSVCLCGDISEPGFKKTVEAGTIPSFDIPYDAIDKYSREFRLNNKTTTDDHCMHIVGYLDKGEMGWFLLKDSGAGGFEGPDKGFRFIREDYIKLKMMNIMVYKEGARKVLDQIIK